MASAKASAKASGARLLARGLAGMAMVTAAALPAPAAEPGEEAPDAAFLEYLGSWEEDDSDWIALARTAPEEAERRAAPAEREQDEESRTDEETG
jgi:hypothetical protein